MGKRIDALGYLGDLGVWLDSAEKSIKLAEKILRIRDKSGRVQPLVANEAQRIFEKRRGRANVVLKARQMGITTWVAGRFFLRTALQEGATSLLVAHNRESAECVFGIVRRMWEQLPAEVRDGALRLRTANVGEMIFAETGSEFRVASAADVNAGRGLSLQNLHCSEVSRWPGDAGATLAGLRAALAPGGELVLESTPCGAYGAFYEVWKAGVESDLSGLPEGCEASLPGGEDGLVRHFFPWWMEPTYTGRPVEREHMTTEEHALVDRHGLSGAQVGFRRGLEKSFGGLRTQEFAEDAELCFRTAGSCCFELEVIERRLAEVGEPSGRRRNGSLLQWLGAVPGRSYVIAVDTAGGGADGDFAAVQVVDVVTGMQCAELQERLRPADLVPVCLELANEYRGALVAVERNNHGSAVIALLEMCPDVRMYRQGGQPGWLTSAASKPEIVARLGMLLQAEAGLFQSRRLLGECRTFVSNERGRAGAIGGAHDDLVMAMAIAQAVRAEVMGLEADRVFTAGKEVQSFFRTSCVSLSAVLVE